MKRDELWDAFRRSRQDFQADPAMEAVMRSCMVLTAGFMLGADMPQCAASVEVAFRKLWPDVKFPEIM